MILRHGLRFGSRRSFISRAFLLFLGGAKCQLGAQLNARCASFVGEFFLIDHQYGHYNADHDDDGEDNQNDHHDREWTLGQWATRFHVQLITAIVIHTTFIAATVDLILGPTASFIETITILGRQTTFDQLFEATFILELVRRLISASFRDTCITRKRSLTRIYHRKAFSILTHLHYQQERWCDRFEEPNDYAGGGDLPNGHLLQWFV